jgi:hypothetical protein
MAIMVHIMQVLQVFMAVLQQWVVQQLQLRIEVPLSHQHLPLVVMAWADMPLVHMALLNPVHMDMAHLILIQVADMAPQGIHHMVRCQDMELLVDMGVMQARLVATGNQALRVRMAHTCNNHLLQLLVRQVPQRAEFHQQALVLLILMIYMLPVGDLDIELVLTNNIQCRLEH